MTTSLNILDCLNDTLTIVAENLCALDRMALAFAFPTTRPYLKIKPEDLGDIVKARLNDYKFSDALNCFVNTGEIVVSGSFILQCLLDVSWNTDIDMYSMSDLTKDKLGEVFTQKSRDVREYSSLMPGLHTKRVTHVYVPGSSIVIDINTIDSKIHTSIGDFLTTCCDMDILMNYYEGNVVFIKNIVPLLNRKVTVLFSEKTLNQMLKTRLCSNIIEGRANRIGKYVMRGFTVACDRTTLTLLERKKQEEIIKTGKVFQRCYNL